MKKDLLTEAYEQISLTSFVSKLQLEGKTEKEIESILKEAGMWDRFKAKGASAVQSVKGAGQTLQGLAKQGAANVAQAGVNTIAKGANLVGLKTDASETNQKIQDLKQSGQNQVADVKGSAQAAKINSIFQSHSQDLNNLMSAIVRDLDKLGIQHSRISANSAGALIGQIKKSLGLQEPAVQSAPKSTADYNPSTTKPQAVSEIPTAA